MKRTIDGLIAIVAVLAFACTACAQSVLLPAKAEGGVNEWVIVAPSKLTVDFNLVNWRASPGLTEVPIHILFPGAKPNGKVYRSSKPGRYKVEAWVEADAKLPLDRSAVLAILQDRTLSDVTKVENAASLLQGISACAVTIGEPGPDPGPKPPEPLPPVPVGFRVLLVHEAQTPSPAFFDGRAVKTYLDAKTVKDGTHPSWRRIDQNLTGANLPTDLRLLWEAAKPKITTLPAVVIAVNTQVTIHPLPADEAGLLQLLRSKGGE